MRLHARCRWFLVLSILYFPATGLSQQQSDTNPPRPTREKPYHLVTGSSSLREIGGERVILLRDGVRITHGDVVVTSRSGEQYTDQRVTLLMGDVNIDQHDLHMEGDEGEYHRFQDKAILRGNVRILDQDWDLRCDEATFFRTTEKAYLRGNVVAIETASTLRCDSLIYDKQNATAEVFGDVQIDNAEEGVRARGQHAFYYRDRKEGLIDHLPTLVVDPDSPEPTRVVSDTMRFFPDSDRAVAVGRVKIVKGNTITQADTALLFDREQRAELYGRPLARQENTSMQGDKMFLFYDEKEVRQIALVGSAIITEENPDSLVTGRDSWVKGDSMVLHVYSNHLDSIDVVGTATSDYYPQGTASRIEANLVRGKRMFFRFEKDSLSYVNVIGDAAGTYRYLDLKRDETVDSLRSVLDTALTYIPFGEHADKVAYAGDSIEYYAKNHDLVLDGNARVDYRQRTLTGEHITFNADMEVMDAIGSPVLTEGPDKLYGKEMDYDLETGVGLVSGGSTKFMDGFYDGAKIAKVGDDILKVWDSKYTTCDLKTPHYHFRSNQMKVYLNDKVVSGPIYLYIGETPIAYLPFFAQNIRRGRRSGMLRPDFEFGITSSGTRFIRDLGYYWATNDYTDFTVSGDFNERESVRLRVDNRYKLRYRFDGNVNFSYLRELSRTRTQWTLSSNHNHTLGEKFTFNSNLRFVSSDDAPRAVSNLDEVANVIDRRIESRVSLRKSWEKVSFSASGRRVQNLNVTSPTATKITTELPTLTLSIPSRSLYFGETTSKGDKGFWEEFLGGIRYSPGVNFNRTELERLHDRTETIRSGQQLNFSSPRRVGVFNISPQLSTSNTYTRTVNEIFAHDEAVDESTLVFVPGSREVNTENEFRWTTGAGVNTNIYGTFYPEIGILRGIRHTMSPSASYSFQPGIGSQPSNQTVSLGLSNALDLKVRGANEEQDRKLSGVMIWRLAASYDPDAPSRRGWSNISSSINTTQIFGSTFSINQTIDPYQFDILNTSITSSFSLSGTHGFGTAVEAAVAELNVVASDTTDTENTTDRQNESRTAGDTDRSKNDENKGLRWNVTGSLSYTKARTGDPRSTLNVSGSMDLTRHWSVRYNANYDVQERQVFGQFYEIRRDLHCWQMSLSRQQLGDRWEFYFRISIVSLPEVYAERGNRGLGTQSTFGTPFQF